MGDVTQAPTTLPFSSQVVPRPVLTGVPPRRMASFWVALLVSLLLVDGCARPTLPEPPSTPPRLSLSHQAQSRLLKDAREHLEQDRPRTAARLLRNLIDSHPNSPILLDVRWTLAQAYEASEDMHAAVDEYRSIVRAAPASSSDQRPYAEKAERRRAVLEPGLEPGLGLSKNLNLIQISPAHLPPYADRSAWLKSLGQAGITTLVVDIGTKSPPLPGSTHGTSGASLEDNEQPPTPAGVYFRTKWATVIDDSIDQVTPVAHEHGLAVYAAVTLRRMNWLEPPGGWADRTYDPAERQVRRSNLLDLFHPGFQEYLTGLLTDLADTGIDGLVFRADAPMGPTHGFSPFALDRFADGFGIHLDPASLFPAADQKQCAPPNSKTARWCQMPSDYPPEFWRWTGWKARERLKVMDRLRQAMRQHSPKLKFAIEVHPEAIHHPVEALVWYSEDLLEAKRARFDYVIARTDKPFTTHTLKATEPGSSIGSATDQTGAGLVTRLIELMGGPEHVWVTKPLPTNDLRTISHDLNPQADRATLENGIGLLYMKRVPPVP